MPIDATAERLRQFHLAAALHLEGQPGAAPHLPSLLAEACAGLGGTASARRGLEYAAATDPGTGVPSLTIRWAGGAPPATPARRPPTPVSDAERLLDEARADVIARYRHARAGGRPDPAILLIAKRLAGGEEGPPYDVSTMEEGAGGLLEPGSPGADRYRGVFESSFPVVVMMADSQVLLTLPIPVDLAGGPEASGA